MPQHCAGWVQREFQGLQNMRSRPALANPLASITQRSEEISREIQRMRREISLTVQQQSALVASLRAQVATLGPSATLARGYAVVQVLPRDGSGPEVVTSIEQSPPGSQLRVRVGDGSISAASMGVTRAD